MLYVEIISAHLSVTLCHCSTVEAFFFLNLIWETVTNYSQEVLTFSHTKQ
jgi:hypothetical protein